ncbi:hypothetical protein K503DRAFT_593277 [Rhizopogon vinicolor AM-OR11-026]|uniref:Uncharacterized protein n=1 Tax=Rhizopogon vinicolor AM-OR11-026 TaxID=1314800 RepID=A0A1B7MJ44_9AGAM|nr:hypothetical protein K503DRAFT_593277 [Rhizopogon vinicolor AM-OR11-026]
MARVYWGNIGHWRTLCQTCEQHSCTDRRKWMPVGRWRRGNNTGDGCRIACRVDTRTESAIICLGVLSGVSCSYYVAWIRHKEMKKKSFRRYVYITCITFVAHQAHKI